MSIRIVTDSTSDISPEAAREFGITVVPVYINVGSQSYLDGVDITRQQFYQKMPSFHEFAQTSTPGVAAFRAVFEQLKQEGASHIISIHVAGAFSSMCDTVRLAAETVPSIPITVLDSSTFSMGLGFLAIAAAKAAATGKPAAEIVEMVLAKAQRTILYAALDTVEYLRRSGRASRLQASLASFLHIFPVLSVYMGSITMEKIRTRARAVERLAALLQESSPVEDLAILHSNAIEKAGAVRQMVTNLVPPGVCVWTVEVTPAIGAHVGPNAVGLACVRAKA